MEFSIVLAAWIAAPTIAVAVLGVAASRLTPRGRAIITARAARRVIAALALSVAGVAVGALWVSHTHSASTWVVIGYPVGVAYTLALALNELRVRDRIRIPVAIAGGLSPLLALWAMASLADVRCWEIVAAYGYLLAASAAATLIAKAGARTIRSDTAQPGKLERAVTRVVRHARLKALITHFFATGVVRRFAYAHAASWALAWTLTQLA